MSHNRNLTHHPTPETQNAFKALTSHYNTSPEPTCAMAGVYAEPSLIDIIA